jgi:exonuclease SbcD
MESNGSAPAVFGPLGEEFAAFVTERKERGELEAGFAEEFLQKGRAYLTRAASEEPESAA